VFAGVSEERERRVVPPFLACGLCCWRWKLGGGRGSGCNVPHEQVLRSAEKEREKERKEERKRESPGFAVLCTALDCWCRTM